MSTIDQTSVVITGASSGIGEAIARDLAKHGVSVTLGARREDRLKTLVGEIEKAGGKAQYSVTDVTNREEVQSLVDAAISAYGKVDAIINNAGLMPLSMMENLHVEEWERMVDVNIKGVLYGVSAALPAMLKQGSGHILNVSSVAGHLVFPGATVYCGTKFAVRAISEGLRQELAGRVRVTNISPGAIATELPNTITDDQAKENVKPALDIAIDPQSIADAVRYALEQPADVSINEIIVRPTAQTL